MNGEQKIIIAGVVLIVFGVSRAALAKKPIDVPIVGGLVFVLLLSLVSAFGAAASNLAGNFALLGMAVILLKDGPAVLNALNAQPAVTQGTGAAGGGNQGKK